jgi:hypothetical protein
MNKAATGRACRLILTTEFEARQFTVSGCIRGLQVEDHHRFRPPRIPWKKAGLPRVPYDVPLAMSPEAADLMVEVLRNVQGKNAWCLFDGSQDRSSTSPEMIAHDVHLLGHRRMGSTRPKQALLRNRPVFEVNALASTIRVRRCCTDLRLHGECLRR